jgi:hypothetical protein
MWGCGYPMRRSLVFGQGSLIEGSLIEIPTSGRRLAGGQGLAKAGAGRRATGG